MRSDMGNYTCLLTWLVPKISCDDPHRFDPKEFVLGPHDEASYDLHCLEYVCSSKKCPFMRRK